MNIYMFTVKSAITSKLERKLHNIKNKLIKAAQKVYNEWDQINGYDEIYGSGGICQDIAEEISFILNQYNIDCITVDSGGIGEQHVWVIAFDEKEKVAYNVDIPPEIYESGGGYNWKKIPNVKFNKHDIFISEVDFDIVETEIL